MARSKDCKDEQRAILCRIGADREEEDCKDEKRAILILHRIALCRIGASWPDGDGRDCKNDQMQSIGQRRMKRRIK